MSVEVHWYWFGPSSIQKEENRIALPYELFGADLLLEEGTAFWGIEKENNMALLAGEQRPLKKKERFQSKTGTSIGADRVTTVPAFFFSDYKGKSEYDNPAPEPRRLQYNEMMHFITSDELAQDTICYLVRDSKAREFMGQGAGKPGIVPDGGELKQAFGKSSLREKLVEIEWAPDNIAVEFPEAYIPEHAIWDFTAQTMYALPKESQNDSLSYKDVVDDVPDKPFFPELISRELILDITTGRQYLTKEFQTRLYNYRSRSENNVESEGFRFDNDNS